MSDDDPTGNPAIDETIRAYLTAVDRALPGFVRGLDVVGSFALGPGNRGPATSTR